MDTDTLLHNVADLFELLRQRRVEYLLVGGVAMLQYVEGRNTEDIDLIVALQSLQELPEIAIETRDEYFARGKYGILQVDFLLTHNPLFDHVHRHCATVQTFAERDIPCATVEGLLLLKLYALPSLYRQGNFARVGLYENDIATLIHDYQPDISPLLAELRSHLSDTDLGAVDDIVAEIQQRIDRFKQNSGEDHRS